MGLKVVIPQDISNLGKDFLKERGYEIMIGNGTHDIPYIKAIVAQADAIIARSGLYTREIIDAAPNLKVIGRHGIGVDNIDLDYCTQRGIQVTYAPQSNPVSVAEHAIGLMLAAAHHFARFDAAVRKGDWEQRNMYFGADLEGKTLGIVGLGRIGTLVANKARAAFSMNVIGYDPCLPAEKFPADIERMEDIKELFQKADFISMHIPYTQKTKGMINAGLFSCMKPSAFFINDARGEVVNEKDLYEALKNETIRGAAIDVFEKEPPDKNNPLLALPNILLTPHSAALTYESMDRMGLHAAMGVHSVLSGEKPAWPVNDLTKKP